MSFLDAIQFGFKTIMIPQGFQSDLQEFITHKVDKTLMTYRDQEIFRTLVWAGDDRYEVI